MKISKLFHWLYVFLMVIPFLALLFNMVRVSLSGSFELIQNYEILNTVDFPTFLGLSEDIVGIYNYLLETIFGVYGPIKNFVVSALTYWTIISIAYLIFDVFMYVPLLVHRWIDKARLE